MGRQSMAGFLSGPTPSPAEKIVAVSLSLVYIPIFRLKDLFLRGNMVQDDGRLKGNDLD
jgi:hypothetical protein